MNRLGSRIVWQEKKADPLQCIWWGDWIFNTYSEAIRSWIHYWCCNAFESHNGEAKGLRRNRKKHFLRVFMVRAMKWMTLLLVSVEVQIMREEAFTSPMCLMVEKPHQRVLLMRLLDSIYSLYKVQPTVYIGDVIGYITFWWDYRMTLLDFSEVKL